MGKADIIIGIDPDTNMSGVARLDVQERKTWADTLPFPLLIQYLLTVMKTARMQGKTLMVAIECSWRETHNWHILQADSKAVAAKKGYAVGAMHATGRKIVEMMDHYGIPYREVRPLVKPWKGRDRKITHEEMTMVCGWSRKRSNQEERDAMLLAWYESGLPIRIKV